MPFTLKSPEKYNKKYHAVGVAEPVRISTYDIIVENLKKLNRMCYIHRLFYIIEHTVGDIEALTDNMTTTVEIGNKNVFDEPLSGFMLVYPKYLVVMVEGSEYAINEHIGIILAEKKKFFTRMKVLSFFPNINKRFSDSFNSLLSMPTILVEKIDPMSDLKATMNQAQHCSRKMHELIKLYWKQVQNMDVSCNMGDVLMRDFDETDSTTKRESKQSISVNSMSLDPSAIAYREYLPEFDLLDFLLGSRFLIDLDKFHEISSMPVPQAQVSDNIYPVPFHVTVPDIFEEPYNPVCELPQAEKPRNVGSMMIARVHSFNPQK